MDDPKRLDRIEHLLNDLLRHAVRLEDRLGAAGVLTGDTYGSRAVRFAVEHGLPVGVHDYCPKGISRDFYDRVDAWMEAHEDDPEATFVKLSSDFSPNAGLGKENWPDLLTLLEYFVISGQWLSAIARIASDPHPIALRDIRNMLKAVGDPDS